MIRKHFRFKRLVLGLTVGVAVAAFSAPATQAMVYIDRPQAKVTAAGNYGPLDPWAYAVIHRTTQAKVMPAETKYGPRAYAAIHQSSSGRVDANSTGPTAAGRWPSSRATAIVSGIVPSDVRSHRLVAQLVQADRMTSQTSQSGFDWGDAGIGASVSFGVAILLLTAVAVGRRYQSRIDRSGLATS